MRKSRNAIAADGLMHELWEELSPHVLPHFEAAFFDHVPGAAERLIGAAPNEWRGEIALYAYWIGLANPLYRELIHRVWVHDHGRLNGIARGGASLIRRMLSDAEFPVPLSGMVTVYRGTVNVSADRAVRGLSWTTSKEVACWFACRGKGTGLVLSATVEASDIIFWSNDRDENEVVLRKPPAIKIDDEPEHWRALADGLEARRSAARHAALASISLKSKYGVLHV